MKRSITKFISLLLSVLMVISVFCAVPLTASAAESEIAEVGEAFTSGDYEYEILDDGTAVITKYKGSATELEIPSTLDGYTVTSIGGWAFKNCSSLTSITIPSSVTMIGSGAFSNCSSLTSITIPKSVTSIGNRAFEDCSSLTSITIPEGVTSIGSDAFYGCTLLTSITIPPSVTSIGEYAFCGCSSLTSINIPSSITSIGGSAFGGTAWYENQPDGLVYAGKVAYCYKGEMPENTSIELKEDTVAIANYAFSGCSSLTSITIPSSVTSIGKWAFEDCSSLTSVTIPSSVTSIGYSAFSGCSALKSITIPSSVTSIGYSAFSGCSALKSITIPSSVTSIGESTFDGTAWYENQPDGLVYAGKVAYEYKGKMIENTSIELKEDTVAIADYAFEDCSSLTSITIPSSVTSISYGAFDNCSSLKDIYYTGNNEDWQNISIYSYNDSLTNATIHYNYNPSTPELLLGDANGDGVVNVKDATTIQKHVAGLITLEGEKLAVADYDKNGTVNVKDATAVQKHVAGLI